MKKLGSILKAAIFKYIPNATVGAFIAGFSYQIIITNTKDYLNLVIVTLLAFSALIFSWASVCDDVNEKAKLIKVAKIFLQSSIFYVFVAGMFVMEEFFKSYKAPSPLKWFFQTLVYLSLISRGFLVSTGGTKAINAMTDLNSKLYSELDVWTT